MTVRSLNKGVFSADSPKIRPSSGVEENTESRRQTNHKFYGMSSGRDFVTGHPPSVGCMDAAHIWHFDGRTGAVALTKKYLAPVSNAPSKSCYAPWVSIANSSIAGKP